MPDRKSKLSVSDCTFLHRKMADVQARILDFITRGCPKEGWRDDMMLCVGLLELGKFIDDKVKDAPK